MLTQIRLLLQEQSDLGLHGLSKRLLKHFSRRKKQTTFVEIVALRVTLPSYAAVKKFREQTVSGSVRDYAPTVSLNQTESTTLLFPYFIGSVCFLVKVQPPQICTGFIYCDSFVRLVHVLQTSFITCI